MLDLALAVRCTLFAVRLLLVLVWREAKLLTHFVCPEFAHGMLAMRCEAHFLIRKERTKQARHTKKCYRTQHRRSCSVIRTLLTTGLTSAVQTSPHLVFIFHITPAPHHTTQKRGRRMAEQEIKQFGKDWFDDLAAEWDTRPEILENTKQVHQQILTHLKDKCASPCLLRRSRIGSTLGLSSCLVVLSALFCQ